MYALEQFLLGLLSIHIALIVAYVLGSALLATVDRASPWQDVAALDLVISTGTGCAAIAIVTFFAGLAGLLTPGGLIAVVIAVAAIARALSSRSVRREFWIERLAVIRGVATRPGASLLWIALCALGYPAAQPPTAYDATFYHQVYALEWAQHHRIFADPFRRFPWYASNFLLIVTWFEVVGLGAYAQFASWAAGALAAVLAYGLALRRFAVRSTFGDFAAAFAGLPFLAAPVFLRWWDTGMNDVAIGSFFLLAVVINAANALVPDRRGTIASLVITGFFLGMKPTLPFFFPLFALLAVAAVRAGGGTWRRAAAVTTILVILTAPWYVRNLAEDGDPAPPLLHLALHHDDPTFSLVDAANISATMISDRSPRSLALLPIRLFISTGSEEFREPGTTLVAVLLALPFGILTFALLTGRRNEPAIWAAALVSAYAYWILTDHLARYALLFYPLLAVFCIRCLIDANDWLNAWREPRAALVRSTPLVAALGALILAVPTPASAEWFNAWTQTDFVYGATFFPSSEAFLRRSMLGFREEESVVSWLDAHPRMRRRVLSFRLEPLAYSFAQRNVQSIGDWVGEARYTDLKISVDNGKLPAYLRHFDVSALLIPRENELFKGADLDRFEAAIVAAGFHRLGVRGVVDVFVRNG